jgi:hypothetical protein
VGFAIAVVHPTTFSTAQQLLLEDVWVAEGGARAPLPSRARANRVWVGGGDEKMRVDDDDGAAAGRQRGGREWPLR